MYGSVSLQSKAITTYLLSMPVGWLDMNNALDVNKYTQEQYESYQENAVCIYMIEFMFIHDNHNLQSSSFQAKLSRLCLELVYFHLSFWRFVYMSILH